MSTNLYWSLVPEDQKEHDLYDLKRIMSKKLGQGDGSCGEDLGIVNHELIPFLEGIVAGGSEGAAEDAQTLIDAINKHGRVSLVIH